MQKETHSQTLGGTQESLCEGGEENIVGGIAMEDTRRTWSTQSPKQGSWGITETEMTKQSLDGSAPCPLHICYGCVAWDFCGTPNSGSV